MRPFGAAFVLELSRGTIRRTYAGLIEGCGDDICPKDEIYSVASRRRSLTTIGTAIQLLYVAATERAYSSSIHGYRLELPNVA